MRNHLLFGAAVAALVIPAAASAQQITSGIVGTVTDENGAPLAGANVTITDTRTGAERTLTTGSEGTFAATGLVTGGPYTVVAAAAGHEGQTVNDITTTLQGNTSLTFALASGGGEIVVTGSRVRATTLAVGPGTSFGAEVLAAAPSFNRDVRDVIRIDPRVSLDRDDGGSGQDRISCLGGNDRGNTFTVDGIPQSDIYGLNDTGFSSRSSTPLPYDAIRETQVQFAPFDVDYGQFTGCAINVITKSGTNEYTASAFYEYSDSDLRGTTVDGRPVARINPERRWGVALGGPIIKDRLFIYGAYEHHEAGQSQDDGPTGAGYANQQNGISLAQFNEIRQVLQSTYGIDTGDLVYSRDYTNDRYFVRADLQINDQHRLEATYQRLEESTVRPDDLFTGNSPQAIGANTFYKSGTVSDYYSGRLYSQWTDQFSTELRYSRSEIQDLQDPIGGGEAQSGNPIPRIIVGIDNATGNDGAVLAGPGISRSANDLRTTVEQYRAVAKLSAGNHNFKLGFELNKADLFNLFVQNATGTLVFRNINDLRAGLLSPGLGNNQTSTTPANVVSGQTEGAFGNFTSTGDVTSAAAAFDRSIYSAYLQDEWRATDALKVTGGVRIDWYDGGAPRHNPVFAQRYGFSNGNGFSKLEPMVLPRVGFTYDFNNEGLFSRSQLVGGVGIFSGGDPLVWFGNAFQNDGRGFATGNSQAAGCPAGQISVLSGGQFTGVPTCIRQNAIDLAAAGRGNTQSIDPDLKMSTVIRANLGFRTQLNFGESGFFSRWNANLDYIYSEYRNPFTLVDLAQTIDTRKGLNGYTIDGRPIYSAVDLLQTGCTGRLVNPGSPPVYANVNAACFTNTANRFDELMLTNSKGFRSHVASFLLSKNFEGGLIVENGSTWVSFGYAYTNSHDRRNMYNSTAGSNYDQTAAFDRQNPDSSPGFYQSKHNFTFATNFKNEFVADLATSFGFTFVARSGRPYSLTWTGGGAFNNTNSGNDNALVYIPTGANDPNISPLSNATAVADLVKFANSLDCAKKFIGRTVTRNSCTNDWYFDLDLTISQELPGPGRLFGRNDKIKLYGMFDNFLNFIDDSWNVQRRRNFYGVQDIASLGTTTVNGVSSVVDAQGRYIINGFTGGSYPNNGDTLAANSSFITDNAINVSSSVWRFKIGVSYEF
ncbi:TonB-dependent receptor [Sphingomonas sp. BT-65]|uniref:TonB-dependent receptor n=1 Tax=Sphingomonas sp. BT-65 TaxID=2989821 RepID=UPI002235BF8E|nr:TonB-dependent receptor [Sphingomonas sp. BT-65]MCW4463747.1 TonB-dependent receptor [Sphingomonas sp. BT-65]